MNKNFIALTVHSIVFSFFAHASEKANTLSFGDVYKRVEKSSPVLTIASVRNNQTIKLLATLTALSAKNEKFADNIIEKEALWDDFMYDIEKQESHAPYFLLNECASSKCSLSRHKKPNARAAYEEVVEKTLMSCKKEIVSYTSFGCGNLLQDTRILSSYLASNPHGSLNIQLIDTSFRMAIRFLEIIGYKASCEEIEKNLQDINSRIACARCYDVQSDSEVRIPLPVQVNRSVLVDVKKVLHMKKLLTNGFPQAKIAIHIHDSAESYLKEKQVPDIVVAADIVIDMTGKSKATYASMLEQLTALNKGITPENFLLVTENAVPQIQKFVGNTCNKVIYCDEVSH